MDSWRGAASRILNIRWSNMKVPATCRTPRNSSKISPKASVAGLDGVYMDGTATGINATATNRQAIVHHDREGSAILGGAWRLMLMPVPLPVHTALRTAAGHSHEVCPPPGTASTFIPFAQRSRRSYLDSVEFFAGLQAVASTPGQLNGEKRQKSAT